MRGIWKVLTVLEILSTLTALILAISGNTPPAVNELWHDAQTAFLILLAIIAIPAIWLAVLIIQSQMGSYTDSE